VTFRSEHGHALRAVDDVTLRIAEGEVLGLVGESGCGKTTIAKCIAGRIAPTSGVVRFDGRELGARRATEDRRAIQMVFQDPYSSLNPRMTVRHVLSELLRVHGLVRGRASRHAASSSWHSSDSPRERWTACEPILRGPATADRDRRALAVEPRVIIADEPGLRAGRLRASHDPPALRRPARPPRPDRRVHLAQPGRSCALERPASRSCTWAGSWSRAIANRSSATRVIPTPGRCWRPRRGFTRSSSSAPWFKASREPDRHPNRLPFHPRCPRAEEICTRRQTASRAGRHRARRHFAACHFATRHLPRPPEETVTNPLLDPPPIRPPRLERLERLRRRFSAPDSPRYRPAQAEAGPSARGGSARGAWPDRRRRRSTSTRAHTVP